jgi:hypothetical protein
MADPADRAVMADPALLKVLSIMAGVMHRKGLLMPRRVVLIMEDMVHPLQRTQAKVVPWLIVGNRELPLRSNADMVVSTARPT